MSTLNTTSSTVSVTGSPAHDSFCSPLLSAASHAPEKKNIQPSKLATVLADTFPTKTHHLVTQLTETDPKVVTFSPDGAAFFIYDQVKFAEKYLPKYFKHSNYGSFVRQLNLYGFTSSRLKWNSDVVAWTHESFHRDRREDLCNIKRPKKKERVANKPKADPREVPRPSSTSVSDDAESVSPPYQLNDDHRYIQGTGDNEEKHFLRKFSVDVGTQFAYLKQQNRYLEQKLDILLKITLNLGGPDVLRSGEKRRRIDAPCALIRDIAYTHPSSHHYDECKDADDIRFSSDRYGESKFSEDELGHYTDCEPLPYLTNAGGQSYSELPGRKTSVSESLPDCHMKEETFAKFIEVMLTEEDGNCVLSGDSENAREKLALTTKTAKQADASSKDESKQGTESHHDNVLEDQLFTETETNDLEDELLKEAIGTILQESLSDDPDIFSSNFDMDPDLPVCSHEGDPNSGSARLVAMSNRTMDKLSGPEPIYSTDVVVDKAGDIEEGHLAFGVALVSAQVVRDENDAIDGVDHLSLQQELDRQREKKKRRRRLLYLLFFVTVTFACVFAIWQSIIAGRGYKMKKAELNADGEVEMSSEDTVRHENGLFGDDLINGGELEDSSLDIAKNKNHSQVEQAELNADSDIETSSEDSEDSEDTILHENGLFDGGLVNDDSLDQIDKFDKNQKLSNMEQAKGNTDDEMETSSEDSEGTIRHENSLFDDDMIYGSESKDDSLDDIDTLSKNQNHSSLRSGG
ncbi:hypothetical protein ACHAWX_003546 [Stephanocyclus meneghinianus]